MRLPRLSFGTTANVVVLFGGLNLVMVLLFTLIIPSRVEAVRTLPLLHAEQVLVRLAVAAGAFTLMLWALRPGGRTRAELAVIALAGVAFLLLLSWTYLPFLPLAVLPLVMRYWLPLRTTIVVSGAALLLSLPLWSPAVGGPANSGLLIIALLTLGINGYTLTIFEYAMREARAREQLRSLWNLELRAAELAERERLSRELHDTLGHHLTAQRFDLQLMQQFPSPVDAHAAALGRAAERNVEALADLRRTVRALRVDGLTDGLGAAVRTLAERWPAEVRLEVTGEEGVLKPDVKLAMYRAAQEFLTNAERHAPGATMMLALAFLPERVRLTAGNVGSAGGVVEGAGLSGLRARAAQLGGELTVDTEDEVFLVTLDLPANLRERRLA